MNESAKEIVSRIYWQRGLLPPRDWEKEWPKIKEQLNQTQKNRGD